MSFVSNLIATTVLLATPATILAQETSATDDSGVKVMVLGTYHFANPGLDMVNVEADDVLAPHRQVELEAMAAALAEWKPTKILIEAQPDTDDLHMRSYRTRAVERIAEDRNEHFQIGYRLARKLGHSDVYGFDEQPGKGEPNYFPIETVQQWAQAHDAMPKFGEQVARVQAIVEEISADDAKCSISHNLIQHNNSDALEEAHGIFYYGMLGFGDAENQPGADTNAYWYMRNAKMFAKIGLIADEGDRVLVIVGSGHKYWLDHFAELAEGYESVDPRPWLAKADDGRCDG